jgi:hypothetical protein
MPLPVPTLDDRTFDQLVTEGRSLIPRYSQEWTNHNPSDPGMTLVELFAYLTETAIFQLDQVPGATIEQFLRLLAVCRGSPEGGEETLDQALARAVRSLAEPQRAVTAADFETLAQAAATAAGTPLGRTAFAPYRDTACAPADHPEQGPLAALLLVVPDEPNNPRPAPSVDLTGLLFRALSERRLLATRLHVIGPEYVEVAVRTVVARRPGSGLTPAEVEQVVRDFLHPLRGGTDGTGWPFGRPVYYSEMFQLLEGLPKVDHVQDLRLSRPPDPPSQGEGIDIPPLALVFVGEVVVQVVDVDSP